MVNNNKSVEQFTYSLIRKERYFRLELIFLADQSPLKHEFSLFPQAYYFRTTSYFSDPGMNYISWNKAFFAYPRTLYEDDIVIQRFHQRFRYYHLYEEHHHRNGVYSHPSLSLLFQDRPWTVNFPSVDV
jgi:hypothetical protein